MAPVDVMRTFRATNRHTFLDRVQDGINDWKADDVNATIIADVLDSILPDIASAKDEWSSKMEAADHDSSLVEAENQQVEWDWTTQNASQGLHSARSWRDNILRCVEELARVKVCWANMWYLYEGGLDENSDSVKETWSGLRTRYSTLLQIEGKAVACASEVCTTIGVRTISDLRVVGPGEGIE